MPTPPAWLSPTIWSFEGKKQSVSSREASPKENWHSPICHQNPGGTCSPHLSIEFNRRRAHCEKNTTLGGPGRDGWGFDIYSPLAGCVWGPCLGHVTGRWAPLGYHCEENGWVTSPNLLLRIKKYTWP